MTDHILEQISAAVDDELPAAEAGLLVRRLTADTQLRARWERYHLISDSLRNHLPRATAAGLAARVHAALEPEPVPGAVPGRMRRILKPAAGFAIAASVALIAVVGVQTVQRQTAPAPVQVATAPDAAPAVAADLAPAATVAETGPVPGATRNMELVAAPGASLDLAQPGATPDLNDYLLSHSGHVVNPGMQGMLPYVRIVGYEPGE